MIVLFNLQLRHSLRVVLISVENLLVMFVESVVSVVTEPGFVVLLVSKELVLVEARLVVESDVDLLEVFPVSFNISVRRYIGQLLNGTHQQ